MEGLSLLNSHNSCHLADHNITSRLVTTFPPHPLIRDEVI